MVWSKLFFSISVTVGNVPNESFFNKNVEKNFIHIYPPLGVELWLFVGIEGQRLSRKGAIESILSSVTFRWTRQMAYVGLKVGGSCCLILVYQGMSSYNSTTFLEKLLPWSLLSLYSVRVLEKERIEKIVGRINNILGQY